MVQVNVKDVVGPSLDNSCYIVLVAGNKIFSIESSFANAEICHGLLQGEIAANAYEFLADILEAVKIKIDRAELEAVNGSMYGKIYLKAEKEDKPLRLASSSVCAVINAAFAARAGIEMSEELLDAIQDESIAYYRLKTSFIETWPLLDLDSTELLEILSDYVDKVQYKQEA